MSLPTTQIEARANELAGQEQAKSVPHFEQGISNCSQLSKGMSLLMADLLTERISTSVANSVCNSAGKMLKAVEMQQRYGKTGVGGEKELPLIG